MRVMEIKEFGAPEMLVSATRPDPVVPTTGSGEILIKVIAAGINRPDVLQRKGFYPVPAGASDIPGLEVAGEIVGGDLAHADNLFGWNSRELRIDFLGATPRLRHELWAQ